ncbi:MAG: hypothetical protein KAI66_12095 [Lentisphaeria bacterium]|nr:hypothetical protein [Lentisphaeria bacterium]
MSARRWMCASALVLAAAFFPRGVAAQAQTGFAGGVRAAGVPGSRLGTKDVQRLLRELESVDSGRYKYLVALREKDPEAFRRKLLALARSKRDGTRFPGCGSSSEEQAVRVARERFLAAKDDRERLTRRAGLRKTVEAAFDARLAWSRKRALCLEKELASFRVRIAKMEQNRDKVCSARMEKLTSPK